MIFAAHLYTSFGWMSNLHCAIFLLSLLSILQGKSLIEFLSKQHFYALYSFAGCLLRKSLRLSYKDKLSVHDEVKLCKVELRFFSDMLLGEGLRFDVCHDKLTVEGFPLLIQMINMKTFSFIFLLFPSF